MSDEQQIPATETTPFLVKVIVAVIVGPKIGGILAQHGVNLDPATITTVVAGLLHKLHLVVKQATGWTWL